MTRTTTNHRWHRLARPVLSALAACGLLAALAAPAAADQVSLNKASPILFRATEGAGAPADAPAAPEGPPGLAVRETYTPAGPHP